MSWSENKFLPIKIHIFHVKCDNKSNDGVISPEGVADTGTISDTESVFRLTQIQFLKKVVSEFSLITKKNGSF